MIMTTSGLQPASTVDAELLRLRESGDSKMPTEEVEVDCDNNIECKQKAELGNNYCKKCESERKCLNYPHCEEKPDVGKLLCDSCIEDLEDQPICENCGQKVGLKETLCDPCLDLESQRRNGELWWENS